ncbi:hypothetical protein [Bacillus thuringiensis]|uniref:hypothetical protein n=1 Tax=Bacillus thuringiensis TaxID=1428 RepID=UPI000BFD41FB|nr:hypothetical protein [Bacillus thuringiensis]PGT89863.1 hypothetical protein COD17_08930 [Bacillus thuringiensis]
MGKEAKRTTWLLGVVGSLCVLLAVGIGIKGLIDGIKENSEVKTGKVYQVYVAEKEVNDGNRGKYRLKLQDEAETHNTTVNKTVYNKVEKGSTVNIVKVNDKWVIKE